jgi:hypothetical protein
MIVLRHYASGDLKEVRELHKRQGFDYALPDLNNPTVSCAVIEENGKIVHVMLLRRTLEAYWIFDPREMKRDILGKMLIFNKEMPSFVKHLGFEDVHAWLPPQVTTDVRMHKLMLRLGWTKAEWACYGRKVI